MIDSGLAIPSPRLLLSARDAAKALAISERTILSLTQPRGDLPAVRIGRLVHYDIRDLEKWIETRKGTAP